MRALARELKASTILTRHEDLWYKSHVIFRRQFMSEQIREIKHHEASERLWYFSDEENVGQAQKIVERARMNDMNDGYVPILQRSLL